MTSSLPTSRGSLSRGATVKELSHVSGNKGGCNDETFTIYIYIYIYVDMPIFSYYPITITKNYTVILLNHAFVRFSLKIRSNTDSWPGAGRANQFLLRQNFALLKQHLCGWAAFGRKQSQSQQVREDCFIPKLKMLILGMQNQ